MQGVTLAVRRHGTRDNPNLPYVNVLDVCVHTVQCVSTEFSASESHHQYVQPGDVKIRDHMERDCSSIILYNMSSERLVRYKCHKPEETTCNAQSQGFSACNFRLSSSHVCDNNLLESHDHRP